MRPRDPLTLDMFELPTERPQLPGALDMGMPLRHLLSDLLKASRLSREQAAARMSELLGHSVSKHQLDAWTAESREGWRFPLEYLPALEAALDTHAVTAWLADLRGARLSIGREALEAQLGRVERIAAELAQQKKAIKKALDGTGARNVPEQISSLEKGRHD